MSKIRIICTGMLDTKGEEIRFLADTVKKYGAEPIIMDLSLGSVNEWADIPLDRVLSFTGASPEQAFSLPRSEAVHYVGKAAAAFLRNYYDTNGFDGVISWAGSIGTSTVTYAMRALPLGVPKIMLSTSASGNVCEWLGNSDIHIANPVSEKGINKITRKTVEPAVASAVAMAEAMRGINKELTESAQKKIGAVTLYGTTTLTASKCAENLENKGWDCLFIHQTGTGAVMEDLIRSGDISAVYDITPGELTNTTFGSVFGVPADWKGERFTAAFDCGIPCVCAPGGMDQVAFGPPSALPEKIIEEFADGTRVSLENSGKPYTHASSTVIIPITLDEIRDYSLYMAERINRANAPVTFFIPMKGWSAYDQSKAHASRENGWSRDCDAPAWIPGETNPEWSARAEVMARVLEKEINAGKDNISIVKCDLHILDPLMAEYMNEAMNAMIGGTWSRDMFEDREKVLAK